MLNIIAFFLFFFVSLNANANECPGDVPDDLLPDYLKILDSQIREWAPVHGKLEILNNKVIQITFRFDDDAINILHSRNDMALEFDVVDFDDILAKESEEWIISHTTLPEQMVIKKDVSASDTTNQLSIIAIGTQYLEEQVDYIIKIELAYNVIKIGGLKLNIDLSVSFKGVLNPIDCINARYDNLNPTNPWNYWTLEIDQYIEFQYNPDNPVAICWQDHATSYNCEWPYLVGRLDYKIFGRIFDEKITPAFLNLYNDSVLLRVYGEEVFGVPWKNSRSNAFVHAWPDDDIGDADALIVQDYLKDNQWWMLVYNPITQVVRPVHGQILTFWHSNYGYRNYGAPLSFEFHAEDQNNGHKLVIQKFIKNDVAHYLGYDTVNEDLREYTSAEFIEQKTITVKGSDIFLANPPFIIEINSDPTGLAPVENFRYY